MLFQASPKLIFTKVWEVMPVHKIKVNVAPAAVRSAIALDPSSVKANEATSCYCCSSMSFLSRSSSESDSSYHSGFLPLNSSSTYMFGLRDKDCVVGFSFDGQKTFTPRTVHVLG